MALYSLTVDEKHFWAALLYVEQNPVRAGLVAACGTVGLLQYGDTPGTRRKQFMEDPATVVGEDRIREATRAGTRPETIPSSRTFELVYGSQPTLVKLDPLGTFDCVNH